MSKHTPEPWTEPRVYTLPDGSPYRVAIWGRNGRLVHDALLERPDDPCATFNAEKIATAHHIRACVHAMPKVEDLLRLIGTDDPQGLRDMRDLRDEIRAVLAGKSEAA